MMHVVVGAGATLAEALELGNQRETCPPLINDFAYKTWADYSPHPALEAFLNDLGYWELGQDPRETFFALERAGKANVEDFFEYLWVNRNRRWEIDTDPLPPGYISGLRISAGGSENDTPKQPDDNGFWDNFLYHGIGRPIGDRMVECFFHNGQGWLPLALSHLVIDRIQSGDLVLNLNYDTVIELALNQRSKSYVYAPNVPDASDVIVCKPHGSLNLVSNDSYFTFGQPEWIGTPQPKDYRSFSGLVPPRRDKKYQQHPIAHRILEGVHDRRPDIIVMWGVGIANSDADLLGLYGRWSECAQEVQVINPDPAVADRVSHVCSCDVKSFESIHQWACNWPT